MLNHRRFRLLLILGLLSHLSATAQPELENAAEVDRNVIYGMYSGLALVMDVYYPKESNGHGVIQISGSGWTRPMGYDARVLSHQVHVKNDGEPLLRQAIRSLQSVIVQPHDFNTRRRWKTFNGRFDTYVTMQPVLELRRIK